MMSLREENLEVILYNHIETVKVARNATRNDEIK